MPRFGNSSAGSLIRAAEAEYNRIQAYNDAEAAMAWDLSAKTPEDYKTYSEYLAKRAKSVENSDPSKALSLTRTGISANRTYVSAEIGRVSTQIKYGNMSSRDKYARMVGLYEQAVSNGDGNLAQSLESQLASLSITIQNEEQSAAGRASSAATSSTKKQIDTTVKKYDEWLKQAQIDVRSGKLSVADYEAGLAQALEGKRQLYADAAEGKYGTLTEAAMESYRMSAMTIEAGDQYQKAIAQYPQAAAGNPSKYLSVNPATGFNDLKALPGARVTEGPDGKPMQTYTGGFRDYVGPDNTPTGTAAERQRFIDAGTEYVFGQGAKDSTGAFRVSPVGSQVIKDTKGNYYVVDQNGKKHYVNPDPNATLQRSSTPINDMPDFGPANGLPNIFSGEGFKDAIDTSRDTLGKVGSVAAKGRFLGPLGAVGSLAGNLISTLTRRNETTLAKQQAAKAAQQAYAAAQARAAADAAARARATQKLLPVFRPTLPPAPTPAKPQFRPLPGQPGYQNGITQALTMPKTGNNNVDIFRATEALRGGYNL